MKHYNQLVRHSGNSQLFQAVELSATAMAGGHPFHIHAEGLRGTGKTTILRAAGTILPPITRIKHCIYNCDPAKPHCPEHRYLSATELAQAGTEEVPRPFLEISHAAKIGTVVGSIDLGKLVDRVRPAAALMPGSILRAHRGVLFIDEINRLADTAPELADVLLDVMGTKPGRVQVE
jgi:magnesium chelatase subunit I